MLEHIIIKIHELLINNNNPYTLESNKNAIIISFNDLLKNSISIKIILRESRFRYFIMDKNKDWKTLSKSTLKVLMNTLIERPTFDNLIESIGIENH